MADLIDKFSEILENYRNSVSQLEEFKGILAEQIGEFENKISSLEEKIRLIDEKDAEIKKLKQENKRQRDELNQINEQLQNISKLYQEISKEKKEELNVKELLSIYVVLLEEVFNARPHAKILYLLHGDQKSMSREALTKSTGFQPAVVLHSIHDLKNADLVDYSDETGYVTLKKKVY